MNIYGKRIILRAIELQDRDMLLELMNDPDTEKMIGGLSFPTSRAEQSQWIEKQIGNKDVLRCVVADIKRPEEGIGTIILNNLDYRNGTAEVHIKMSKDKGRGKGYASDALETISRYAFRELRLNCVYSFVLSYNEKSIHLFEHCGYQKEGILRQRIYKNGKSEDVIVFSLLKTEYINV